MHRYHFANGTEYQGLWHSGKMHGPGKWKGYSPNAPNKVFSGVSVNGSYQSAHAKQCSAAQEWKSFYSEEVSQSAVAALGNVADAEDDAAAEEALVAMLVDTPAPAEPVEVPYIPILIAIFLLRFSIFESFFCFNQFNCFQSL